VKEWKVPIKGQRCKVDMRGGMGACDYDHESMVKYGGERERERVVGVG